LARPFVIPRNGGAQGQKHGRHRTCCGTTMAMLLLGLSQIATTTLIWPVSSHMTFVMETKKLHERYPDDIAIRAVYRFLKNGDFSAVFEHPLWNECVKIPGCNLTFKIDGQTQLICEARMLRALLPPLMPLLRVMKRKLVAGARWYLPCYRRVHSCCSTPPKNAHPWCEEQRKNCLLPEEHGL